MLMNVYFVVVFFFQAEDGIRDLVRSRGLGDVYKRQARYSSKASVMPNAFKVSSNLSEQASLNCGKRTMTCLLYTSDAADERSSVDLGGRRIIKKKNKTEERGSRRNNIKSTRCSQKIKTHKTSIERSRM